MQYTYACHQDQEISICLRLFQESLADPLETVPAADEDEAADVLVEGEYGPHGDEAPAEGDAQDVASYDLYAPHDDDSEDNREVDVTCASEGVHAEEIERTTVLEEYLYPEYRCSGRYDPWVRSEH